MRCPRCEGLLVRDVCCDLAETQGMWVKTTRCMNCGHVTDPTMERNRQQVICAPSPAKTISERVGTATILRHV